MIRVEELSKSFKGVKAVAGISFEVQEQETLVLLGTSGCGKTTTLKMINRLMEPDGGKIFIRGKDVTQRRPAQLRLGIGYVLQNNGLFPHYTVAQNIAVVPQLLGWDKKRTERRVSELTEKLHLDKRFLNAYPRELSGGQQQRVGLARALVADPPVLLMDEPFGALDNVTRARIHAEFKALDELKRKTIVMVTHDVQEAFELGDRICLMDKGKIIQNGTPSELLFDPANGFVKDFLDQQRLQLEFKTTTLHDIIPQGQHFKLHDETITADSDLWSVLEAFKFAGRDSLYVCDHERNKLKNLSFDELMAAFYKYKKQKARS